MGSQTSLPHVLLNWKNTQLEFLQRWGGKLHGTSWTSHVGWPWEAKLLAVENQGKRSTYPQRTEVKHMLTWCVIQRCTGLVKRLGLQHELHCMQHPVKVSSFHKSFPTSFSLVLLLGQQPAGPPLFMVLCYRFNYPAHFIYILLESMGNQLRSEDPRKGDLSTT